MKSKLLLTYFYRFIQYKIGKVRENWHYIKWPLQFLAATVVLVEYFWNRLETKENEVSFYGAIFLLLSVEVLYRIVPRYEFFARYGGIWLFGCFSIYMAEITVTNSHYKLYEGFLVLGSVEFIMSITLTVDIWV